MKVGRFNMKSVGESEMENTLDNRVEISAALNGGITPAATDMEMPSAKQTKPKAKMLNTSPLPEKDSPRRFNSKDILRTQR